MTKPIQETRFQILFLGGFLGIVVHAIIIISHNIAQPLIYNPSLAVNNGPEGAFYPLSFHLFLSQSIWRRQSNITLVAVALAFFHSTQWLSSNHWYYLISPPKKTIPNMNPTRLHTQKPQFELLASLIVSCPLNLTHPTKPISMSISLIPLYLAQRSAASVRQASSRQGQLKGSWAAMISYSRNTSSTTTAALYSPSANLPCKQKTIVYTKTREVNIVQIST